MSNNTSMVQNFDRPSAWLGTFPPRRWHLLLAAGCVIVIYLGSVTGKWWPTPDSALYLGLGRSLANGEGYRFNGEASNTVTPGLPLILAALALPFGENYWSGNLFAALCGLGMLALVYRTITSLSDRRTALAVVLCCAFSYTFYFNCHRILTDVPFAAMFWVTIWAFLRARRGGWWWFPLAFASMVAGLTIRAPGILVIVSLSIALMFDRVEKSQRKKHALFALGLLTAACVLLGVFYLLGKRAANTIPLYATTIQRIRTVSFSTRALRIVRGTLSPPCLMAEMLTGQKGLVATIVTGLPACACMIIGAAVSWKRGLRMPVVLVALCILAYSFLGGPAAVRPRYLLPVQPLMVYLTIAGLLWTVGAVHRWRGKKPTPSVYLKAATVFTVFVLAANAPRLLRNAVYYTYLSYTPRYYEVIRHGRHAERFRLAEVLRALCPREGPIANLGNDTSILHYLTARRVVLPPWASRENASDAERVMQFVNFAPDVRFIVVDTKEGKSEFRKAVQRAVKNSSRLHQVYQGPRWQVYRRRNVDATSGRPAACRRHFRWPGEWLEQRGAASEQAADELTRTPAAGRPPRTHSTGLLPMRTEVSILGLTTEVSARTEHSRRSGHDGRQESFHHRRGGVHRLDAGRKARREERDHGLRQPGS